MTWVRLDDGFVRHPRMVAAGLHGRALFVAGLCYCGAHLTDGRIPKAAVPIIAMEAGVKPSVARKLVEIGSWVDDGDSYEIHDFLVYNPSRSKVLREREAGAERQRKSRESRSTSQRDKTSDKPVTVTVTNGVSARDPSRPVPPTSSSNGSSNAPLAELEEDLEQTCTVIARRKLDLRADQGEPPPNNPDAWCTKVGRNDADRLREQHNTLRAEHPDWTHEQLADELDPGTATDARNCLDADETAAVLAEQEARARQAVPMPEHMRSR